MKHIISAVTACSFALVYKAGLNEYLDSVMGQTVEREGEAKRSSLSSVQRFLFMKNCNVGNGTSCGSGAQSFEPSCTFSCF